MIAPTSLEKRNSIAIYKAEDGWRLITREISTRYHADKMADKYRKQYKVKVIDLDLVDK